MRDAKYEKFAQVRVTVTEIRGIVYDRLQESKRDDVLQHYGSILRYL